MIESTLRGKFMAFDYIVTSQSWKHCRKLKLSAQKKVRSHTQSYT